MPRLKIWAGLLLVLIACSPAHAISFVAKIEPNKGRPGTLVKISDNLSFQATATPNGKDVRFQVKITCKGCVKLTGGGLSKVNPGFGGFETPEEEKLWEQQRKLADSGQPADSPTLFRVCPCVEDYPDAPKVTTTRKGDTITADFTVPGVMIDDDTLAFYFSVGSKEWCCSFSGYYAVLKEFR